MMSDPSRDNLEERVRRLEKKVEQLQQKSKAGFGQKADGSQHQQVGADNSEPKPAARKWSTSNLQLGEEWLNRIGIGLLLIGVAFLFKYSIDQGWLIPQVRSAIGLGIGLALFGGGLQLRDQMSPLKQILLGGGIAVFYITGFATFQLYAFLPAAVVWSFMVIVTLLSLSLSLQQDEAILSVVGTLGAFGTPFMLYGGDGSVVMLMCYTALVLAGTTFVYMRKGWKTLLWSISLGGALVLFVGIATTTFDNEQSSVAGRWALQTGIFLWMGCGWFLPTYRETLTKQNPVGWPTPAMLSTEGAFDENRKYYSSTNIHLLLFIVPIIALVMFIALWELSMDEAGYVGIGLAGLSSLGYLPLRRKGLDKLASSNGFLALLMLTISFVLMLEGNFLFIVLATEAVGLRYISYQTNDDAKISLSAHLLFVIVCLWVVNTLYYSLGSTSVLWDVESITQFGVIAAGGILIPHWLSKNSAAELYQAISHLLMLLWLYQKFAIGQNGQAWATIMWALYAVVLLVVGFVRREGKMRITAMGTIFLVVAKLLVIDLAQMEAIWRILMFMGFGAVFLLLGYYWQSRWNES